MPPCDRRGVIGGYASCVTGVASWSRSVPEDQTKVAWHEVPGQEGKVYQSRRDG
jgi:hypothetical protein